MGLLGHTLSLAIRSMSSLGHKGSQDINASNFELPEVIA